MNACLCSFQGELQTKFSRSRLGPGILHFDFQLISALSRARRHHQHQYPGSLPGSLAYFPGPMTRSIHQGIGAGAPTPPPQKPIINDLSPSRGKMACL